MEDIAGYVNGINTVKGGEELTGRIVGLLE
jgi:hypothetical protein